jgi:hypothetical protein
VITRPESTEHVEGPKKVKELRSILIIAVSACPHNDALFNLNFHDHNARESLFRQLVQEGKSICVTGKVSATGAGLPS